MKFLCVPCDEPMRIVESGAPDEPGSLTITFRCHQCGHVLAMLANAGETQLVHSLGVRIGASEKPSRPFEHLQTSLTEMRADVLQAEDEADEPVWAPAALERLNATPSFVQPMIRQAYGDYAREKGLREITPEVMDAARRVLGMG